MILELKILPLGRGRSISGDIAEVVKIIDASGVDYRLTAEATILEGTWDRLMDLAKSCHSEMRKRTDRVITIMYVDDYDDRTDRLNGAVDSVMKKIGKTIRR
jgi:uncharacterized protein (TIGR00106 family)